MSVAALDHPVSPTTAVRAVLDTQREVYRRDPFPSHEVRADRVRKLMAVLKDRQHELADAVSDDFGHRSRHETLLIETFVIQSAGKYVLKHLKGWMKPESRSVSVALLPASAKVVPQPLGVIGIVSPWNYPLQLSMVPLLYALAAGNRAMIKPSELTPRTSAKLAEILGAVFPEDLVAVVQGGPEVGQAFCEQPLDHLMYTGSTHVGRLVMQAAAKNLVPVTLELGGKSPVVVHPEFPVEAAAEAVASVKMANAGQTCVAPDYVLVTRDRADALVDAIAAKMAAMYPRLADNPDYTSVINGRHRARLQSYLDDAKAKGARAIEVNPANERFEDAAHKMAPVILRGVTDEMVVMQEEIFGPVLPIVEVGTVEEAIRYVNDRPRPLALYYFDRDQTRIDDLLRRTHSGGVTVNDCALHVIEEHLPFGGVGPSGMGAYHGKEGFDTFSHRKAVLHQPRLNSRWLTLPPFGRRVERLVDWLT
ncbi:MAG: coniferyl aldehyde dehydrogenase [Alphaproteobacteria bacterium]|nr:coniferyl aldehyde dehydrogenase [Alphaproteobacteria bacterium]MCB9698229.1 coniferyl aldehyde dehydrogenase [Alphaproteobacteria bacterium]